jgi:hypothetical protein
MNKLKFYVRKALGLTVHYYYPRAPIPAVTHLPVLMGLARLYPVRRVLEFGAGKFSTLSLLDRSLFPDIEAVHSYETSPEWLALVQEKANGDPRLSLELIGEDVQNTAARCTLSGYDLIFVDNGPNRAATIRALVARQSEWSLMAIHDFEEPPYTQAAQGAKHCFVFTAYCPNTGVLWNNIPSPLSQFRKLNRAMAADQKRGILASESPHWATAFPAWRTSDRW